MEPSHDAVEKSSPRIQPNLICDMMRPGLLEPEQFDMICMFQVFDHIGVPGMLLDECFKALKPGGGILCFNHDVRAFSARLLGERSPIFDIEHTYLYDQKTIGKIFMDHGFTISKIGSSTNTLSLKYFLQLFPLPKGIKIPLLTKMNHHSLGNINFPIQGIKR